MFFNFKTIAKVALAVASAYSANAAPTPSNQTEMVQTFKSVAYIADWYVKPVLLNLPTLMGFLGWEIEKATWIVGRQ